MFGDRVLGALFPRICHGRPEHFWANDFRGGVSVKKADFIARVRARANALYGVEFTAVLINDLIKNGLIAEGSRKANEGRKPVYDFDFRAYRRALQIARLWKMGIRRRDAIRVQLFLRDYSLPVWDARETLLREYRFFVKSKAMRVRSSYAGNWKGIPRSRKKRLLADLGALDDRLDAAGWRLQDNSYIACVRAAKQDSLGTSPNPMSSRVAANFEAELARMRASITKIIKDPSALFSGLLNLSDNESNCKDPDSIEGLIQTSDDATYLQARDLYRILSGRLGTVIFGTLMQKATPPSRKSANGISVASIKDAPEWVCSIFVLSLRLVAWSPSIILSSAALLTPEAQRALEKIAELPGMSCQPPLGNLDELLHIER
jgi:hypothetical protein